TVTVRRDGRRVDVDATAVVPGDVLLLGPGDRIAADATVAVATNLRVDMSLLTGESEPIAVEAAAPIFAGTFVVEGDGEAVVTATGVSTRLATIASFATTAARSPTPLSGELHRVVRTIAKIALGVGVAFFGLALALGNSASDGF